MNVEWTPLAPVTTLGGEDMSIPSPIDGSPMVVSVPALTVEGGSNLLMQGFTTILGAQGLTNEEIARHLHFDPGTKVRYVDDSAFDGVADAYYDLESGELRIPKSLADAIIALQADDASGTAPATSGPIRGRGAQQRSDRATLRSSASHGAERLGHGCERRAPSAAADHARAALEAISPTTTTTSDHDIAVALALVAHEAVHASQHRSGRVDQVLDQARLQLDAGDQAGAIELVARELELPAQRAQEEVQHAMGAIPRTTTWLTLDATGTPLSDDVATTNIVYARAEDILSSITGVEEELPGRRLPGRRLPGRRLPGELMA